MRIISHDMEANTIINRYWYGFVAAKLRYFVNMRNIIRSLKENLYPKIF